MVAARELLQQLRCRARLLICKGTAVVKAGCNCVASYYDQKAEAWHMHVCHTRQVLLYSSATCGALPTLD